MHKKLSKCNIYNERGILMKKIAFLLSIALATTPALADFYQQARKEVSSAAKEEAALTLRDITSSNIRRLVQQSDLKTGANSVRITAMKRMAFEYGLNVGRAEQHRIREKAIEEMSAQLDRDFDFEKLLIHRNPAILPPIVTQGFDNFKSVDRSTMQVSASMLKIEVPAQIVTVIPTWRDYLKISHVVDKQPIAALLPKTRVERQIWDEAVKEGYEKGREMADLDWENKWGELRRDYDAMLNYKKALANGLIDPVIFTITDLGNVIDKDGNVSRQNEMMIKIVQDARFTQKRVDRAIQRNKYPAMIKLPNGKNM